MAELRPSDRYLLGDAGLEADTKTYVEAVAGSGVGETFRNHALLSEQGIHQWTPRAWMPPRLHDISSYRRRWREFATSFPRPRLVLPGWVFGELPDPLSVARLLARPELEAGSAFVYRPSPRSGPGWEWPVRIAASADDIHYFRLKALGKQWPADTLSRVRELTRDNSRNEILIIRGTVRSALQTVLASSFGLRASHLILVGPTDLPWVDIQSAFETLAEELQAGGASLVATESPEACAAALAGLMRELSHNEPLDVALQRTFASTDVVHLLSLELIHAVALPTAIRRVSNRLNALPPIAALNIRDTTRDRVGLIWKSGQPTGELARELAERASKFPYFRESEGGTAATELAEAERAARRDASEDHKIRSLQADLFEIRNGERQKKLRPLRAGATYILEVFVAPDGKAILHADKVFPENELNWRISDRFTLTVLFAEPNQWDEVQRGKLRLPRYGSSDRCTFVFTPRNPGPFRARLTLCYRDRILQTALLETEVFASSSQPAEGSPPSLKVEALVRTSLATLDDRQRFDASVVFNQTVNGRPTMQAEGDDGAYIASLDKVSAVLEKISARLNEAAQEARRYSKGLRTKPTAELLVDLATKGNSIYRDLVIDYIDRSSAARALRDSNYLQILAAKPDAIVPLELVYEYPPPADGVQVCVNARKALANGGCPATCKPTTSPAPHVCPMGFWGLRKVIERHLHNPQLAGAAHVTGVEPVLDRRELSLNGTSLLAVSENVPPLQRRKLTQGLKRSWSAGAVNVVTKWAEWPTTVQTKKPVLLLALPHSIGSGDGISLEISGDTLPSRFIIDSYVRAPPELKPPLVVLLGCDTAAARSPREFISHVTYFRQASAPVILGTLATVDGTDAATCATKLIEHLVAVIGNTPVRFGTVLLQTKREAVASGLVMALGLVGFGDADWQLQA
jgi:hypothetical protein